MKFSLSIYFNIQIIVTLTALYMKNTKNKGTTSYAFSKFVENLFKAFFQPSTNADFYRLKNFIC